MQHDIFHTKTTELERLLGLQWTIIKHDKRESDILSLLNPHNVLPIQYMVPLLPTMQHADQQLDSANVALSGPLTEMRRIPMSGQLTSL